MKKMSQPSNFKVNLYPHQITAISHLENYELHQEHHKDKMVSKVRSGIYHDIHGYGKTFTMLGLIERDRIEWDMTIPYIHKKFLQANSYCEKTIIARIEKINVTLVLTTGIGLYKWSSDLDKTSIRYWCVRSVFDMKKIPENTQVVLVTVNMYNNLIRHIPYAWKRFIIDDPENVKVKDMEMIHCGFIWFVCADIESLRKSYSRSNTFLKYLTEADTSIEFKNANDFVKKSWPIPYINNNLVHYTTQTSSLISLTEYIEKIKNKTLVNSLLEKIEVKIKEPCMICYSDLNDPVLEPKCVNIFCKRCIMQWILTKGNCPACRTENIKQNIINIEETSSKSFNKIDAIVSLIKPDKKYVICGIKNENSLLSKLKTKEGVRIHKIHCGDEKIYMELNEFSKPGTAVAFVSNVKIIQGVSMPFVTDLVIDANTSPIFRDYIKTRICQIGCNGLTVHHLVEESLI